MAQCLHAIYRSTVKHIPYSIKHRVNIIRIRGWHGATQLYNRILLPTHPVRSRFIPQLSWWYQLNIQRKEPVLIYQMGKVGSSSIHWSLKVAGYFATHLHSLDVEWLLPYFSPGVQTTIKKELAPNWHWLRRNIIQPQKKTRIIALSRDPVAINLANFFHNLDLNTGTQNAHDNLTVSEIHETYLENQEPLYAYMFRWFDEEYKQHLGIDVFQHAFDRETGFSRINRGPYEVLILKLEMSDSEKTRIIADFLGIDQFELVSRNVAADKLYAATYSDFKKQVKIPGKVLDWVYSSPLATHFYTPEEIGKFRAIWE